ncbi:MAG TPA: outer membrane beta-barrel protein [Thermoanaerobaculia bacterium]|nr:outer membrane beta-barrel protein [Thermoanaerobaculia bacterium]
MKRFPLLLVLLVSLPLSAQQQRPDNEVSVSYGQMEVEDALDYNDAMGASYNRYWTRVISTRVGVMAGRGDLPDDNGDASSTIIHATLEAHPFRGRLFSPHAGAGAAYARHKQNYIGSNEVDSRVTLALLGGIDVNFTPRFGVGADMLYSHFGEESDGGRFPEDLTSISVFGSARFRW